MEPTRKFLSSLVRKRPVSPPIDVNVLSSDLVRYVLEALSDADLATAAQVCHTFVGAVDQGQLWMHRACARWPVCALLLSQNAIAHWPTFYRLRHAHALKKPLRQLATHTLLDEPKCSLDDMSLIIEIKPGTVGEIQKIKELYANGDSGGFTPSGRVVMTLPLAEDRHASTGCRCGRLCWDVQELRFMHACGHSQPTIETLALWDKKRQVVHFVCQLKRTVVLEPSEKQGAPGAAIHCSYLLDLHPAYEQLTRQLGAFVQLDVWVDFPFRGECAPVACSPLWLLHGVRSLWLVI
jgi:hypothetical protein